MPFWSLFRPTFQFLDAGRLIDGDLELVKPDGRYAEDVLAACRHPTTLAEAPDMARVTRQGLNHFLDVAPAGHHPGHSGRGQAPAYHFWMRTTPAAGRPAMAGGIGLRIGDSADLRRYIGHIGYNVYPFARGHRLAERSARLLLPLARRHGMSAVWITCNPDNAASHRTCQRLGATYVDTVDLPETHELYGRGERQKCRYRLDL
jgi:tagatose 1,6-diphosphate aldolase